MLGATIGLKAIPGRRAAPHSLCPLAAKGVSMDTKILVADDHEVVRRGVRELLEAEHRWDVVAEAANGREAVELAQQTQPNVAILDLVMPELNGLEATRQIRRAVPHAEVLIFTMHES